MNFVFRSMDRGDTWEKISPDLSYNDPEKISKVSYQGIPYQTITALAESPLKFGLLFQVAFDRLRAGLCGLQHQK